MKTGTASLPLHWGSTPRWLFEQMTKLARGISIILVTEYGTEEYLKRLSDPLWFQAFGCVLGFDWHSSGLTTTTCGAIKEGLKPVEKDLGIFVCGGKGKVSRKTPTEIKFLCANNHISIYEYQLTYASRMAAKVDNNALQDSYQLYHHSFFFTRDGKWAVVQQGMSLDKLGMKRGWARRYHWLSDNVSNFVNEPHKAIVSQFPISNFQFPIMNLVASESKNNRNISTKISQQNPEKTVKTIFKLQEAELPPRHEMLISDINPKNLKRILLSTYEKQPENFENLLGLPGVGPKTIRALALISELVYKTPASTEDPARFSFAHGGKDGTPYPVDRKTYIQSINYLKEALNKAKLGYYEKLQAFRRLGSMV
jgi:hypothetical protein